MIVTKTHLTGSVKTQKRQAYLRKVEKSFFIEAFIFLSSSRTANMFSVFPSVSRYASETKSLRFSG